NIGFSVTVSALALNVAGSSFSDFFNLGMSCQRIGTSNRPFATGNNHADRVGGAEVVGRSESTRIIYLPGNHDEFLREYCGMRFGGIEIVETAVHIGADGRR